MTRADPRPARRRPKPKQLTSPPSLFIPGGDGEPFGDGLATLRDRLHGDTRRPGAPGLTDDDAETVAPPSAAKRDPAALAAAREIAARLAVQRPPALRRRRGGGGGAVTSPYRGSADEIDLDRTLDVIAERRALSDEDIAVREPRRDRRTVVLAVDASGSMRGERLRTAAATVGAVSAELARDRLAVIAFWSDAALLLGFGEQVPLTELVERMLALEAAGLTNVTFPLELAGKLVRGASDPDARVVLLSDCIHNAGPDPRPAAAGLPRLDVLLDLSGEHEIDLARDLAWHGRGRVLPIRGYRDVAPALSRVLGPSGGERRWPAAGALHTVHTHVDKTFGHR